jgi:hypothetical protein
MMETTMQIEFCTRDYEFSHGHRPRGYGSWAFTHSEQVNDEPIWAPASTYSEAKAWIRRHIRQIAPAEFRGLVIITVCT